MYMHVNMGRHNQQDSLDAAHGTIFVHGFFVIYHMPGIPRFDQLHQLLLHNLSWSVIAHH